MVHNRDEQTFVKVWFGRSAKFCPKFWYKQPSHQDSHQDYTFIKNHECVCKKRQCAVYMGSNHKVNGRFNKEEQGITMASIMWGRDTPTPSKFLHIAYRSL